MTCALITVKWHRFPFHYRTIFRHITRNPNVRFWTVCAVVAKMDRYLVICGRKAKGALDLVNGDCTSMLSNLSA